MWHMADINNHSVSDCTREVRTEGSRGECTCCTPKPFSITGTVLMLHASECVPFLPSLSPSMSISFSHHLPLLLPFLLSLFYSSLFSLSLSLSLCRTYITPKKVEIVDDLKANLNLNTKIYTFFRTDSISKVWNRTWDPMLRHEKLWLQDHEVRHEQILVFSLLICNKLNLFNTYTT